jgi:hypothetical protein
MRKVFLCLLLATPALADPPKKDDSVDISAFKAKLKFWTDGKKHYIAAIPMSIGDEENDMAFYSPDGKDFYALRRGSGGSDGGQKTFDWTFWEPRVEHSGFDATLDDKTKTIKYAVTCDDRKTNMTQVPDTDGAKLLAGSFHQFHWTRFPYHLARNDEGTYYFVDIDRSSMDSIRKTGHHVWMGTKGQMKQVKMIDMTSDSEGDVYVTKDGQLRFVVGKTTVEWVQNGKATPLHYLDIEDTVNRMLVYTDLGVYSGEMLGTPCDDL